jgi:NADH dehydrogenase
MNETKIITLVGGSGFIGRYCVKVLASAGYRVQVLCRNPNKASFLKTAGDVGQISVEYADLAKPETLQEKLNHSYAVVNLVGLLFECGKQKFTRIHAQGAEKLAQTAKDAGVEKFIQLSALGVDKASKSKYAKTKMLGEKAVRAAFSKATILRPSVVFGPEDDFFNRFASMASISPFLPLIGGGKTCFQPIYVMDVAHAVLKSIQNRDAQGKTHELAGPDIKSFKELLEYILEVTQQQSMLLPVPFVVAETMGMFAELLPTPPLTRDQAKLLHYDNIVSGKLPGLAELGIVPTALEVEVPTYLARYKRYNAAEDMHA